MKWMSGKNPSIKWDVWLVGKEKELLYKTYKYSLITSWIAAALILLILFYTLLVRGNGAVNGSQYFLTAFFVFISAMLIFIAIGMYRHKKIALLAAAPYTLFAIAYASDHIFGQYMGTINMLRRRF